MVLFFLFSLVVISQGSASSSSSSDYAGPFLNFIDAGENNDKWNLSVLVVASASTSEDDLTMDIWGGEKAISPTLIDTIKGQQFWRYRLSFNRDDVPRKVTYQVGKSSAFTVTVPARKTDPYVLFGSCNKYDKPNSMWERIMGKQAEKPCHLALLAGDQIYNDDVLYCDRIAQILTSDPYQEIDETTAFEVEEEATNFTLNNYLTHYSKPGWREFLASVPNKSLADNHEFFKGKGSYERFLPVMEIVSRVADRFYMLFQHHVTKEKAFETGLIGVSVGDALLSYNYLLKFNTMAFYGLDTRTERTSNQVASLPSRKFMFDKLGSLNQKNIFLITGLPLVYQNLTAFYKISKLVDYFPTLKSFIFNLLGETKTLGKLPIIVEYVDQWAYAGHVEERNDLITKLNTLVYDGKKVTLLAGDPHAAALGEVVDKGTGQTRIQQINSSAITTAPLGKPYIALKKVLGFFQGLFWGKESYGSALSQRLTDYTHMESGKKSSEVPDNNFTMLGVKDEVAYATLWTLNQASSQLEPWSLQGWPQKF